MKAHENMDRDRGTLHAYAHTYNPTPAYTHIDRRRYTYNIYPRKSRVYFSNIFSVIICSIIYLILNSNGREFHEVYFRYLKFVRELKLP